MNLGEMIENVNAELNPVTNIDALLKRLANRGQKRFVSLAGHQFSWMVLNDLSLATEVDRSEYTLSPMVDTSKLITIRDPARIRPIEVITRKEFQERFPDPTSFSGDPEVAYLSGFSAVANEPSSSSVLTFSSSSVSDTSQIVRVEGLTSAGVLVGDDVALNGVTPVPTTNAYVRVLSLSVNGFLSGTLTCTSNAGAVTNATLGPRQRQGKYPKIILYPTPSSVKTLPYDATMLIPALVNNQDFSIIPESYHDAIEDYMLYRGYRHKKDWQGAAEALASFKSRILEAVSDDNGPEKLTSFCGEQRSSYLGEGRFPGLWPKGY